MKKLLLVLLLSVFALALSFCTGGTTGDTGVTVTDTATGWDEHFAKYAPENPVIWNNIWVDEDDLMAICLTGVSYDTLEGEELVLITSTALQREEANYIWAWNKKDISIKQDVDGDGKKDKFKCVDGDPKEIIKGQHQPFLKLSEAEAGGEMAHWKVWFEKTNSAGLVFDITQPFDYIENCSPGCSKMKNVWVQGG